MPPARNNLPRFHGASLRLAREYRCLTKKELAVAAGCHSEHVGRVEADAQPEPLLREAIAEALSFPMAFFHAPPPPAPEESHLHFRQGASVSQRNRKKAVSRGAMLVRLVRELERHVDLPAVRIPRIRVGDEADIEACAEACRAEWGIHPQAPLTSIGRAIEQAGVVMGLLGETDARIQGFSWFDGGRPLIMVRGRSVPSRARLTVAHELGHLVMHRGSANATSDLEEQAFRFAGAFIVPRSAFLREFPRPGKYFDWRAIVDFKQRWGLSVQASLTRAYSLRVISAAQLRTGYIAISRFQWRKDEPGETMERETPHLLPDALKVCAELKLGITDIVRSTPMPLDSIEELTGQAPPPPQEGNVVPLFRKTQ